MNNTTSTMCNAVLGQCHPLSDVSRIVLIRLIGGDVWIRCECGTFSLFSILVVATLASLGVSDSLRYYWRKIAFCLGQVLHGHIEQLRLCPK